MGKIKNFFIYIKIFPESYFLVCIYIYIVYSFCYFLKHIYKMNYLQNMLEINKLYVQLFRYVDIYTKDI